jgi:translocation and assembly module TamB
MGRNEPLTGQADGSVQVAGTWSQPRATATVQVIRGTAWRQPFERLRATLRMDERTQTIESLELTQGPAQLHANADLDAAEGKFSFAVRGSQWRLEDIETLKSGQDFGGEIQFDLAGTGRLASQERSFELLGASGVMQLSGLRLGEREIGSFAGKLRNQPEGVQVDWEGNLVTGTLRGSTLLHPGDESPATGEFRWSKVDVADLAAFAGLSTEKLSGETDGNFTFSGPLLDVDQWRAEGEITRLEVSYSQIPGSDRGYNLWNPFPMRWSVANHELHRLDRMRLLGDGTDVLFNGSMGLEDPRPLDLSTSGTFNLAVIEGFRPELQASGSSVLEVTLRGTAAEPRMNGRMEMRNASLRHRDLANGLSQMNGVLRFNDRQVSIERLTALSGGGTLHFRGMAEHSQEQWSYRLDTDVEHVRFRYPEPVSSVVDGYLTLSGTNLQSLMSGEILVSRVTISSNLELGTILANLAEPRQTLPSDPALGNMQLNVRIDSVPDLRVETALVRGATADLDLRLAGSALNPALLGQINMTQGELDFQGTRFQINRGNISFVNPFRIDPVIDFELETRVRDTDISLTLSGPARKINVTPRSDPPLPFSELITLLALGRSPTTDPVLAARQSVAQQQLTQSGANAILSQALSQPVNRRLQRFFGVSRLKVDPQSGGAEANPSARISTEQQITNELTFTYSYDLSSAQQQVVRVDWTPTRQWSFIVTRDENGLVGADVLFKKRLR